MTILTELRGDERFAGQRLPGRARIAAYLREQGYTRQYERHSELPEAEPKTPQQPHKEWEMDAQGVIEVAGLGKVSIINIGDVYSRMKVESLPCPDERVLRLSTFPAFLSICLARGPTERPVIRHDFLRLW